MPASVDKREARIRGMFAAIAPRYDLLNHLLSFNIDRSWRRRTTRLAPPGRTDRIPGARGEGEGTDGHAA